jgi:hypothetical protein
MRKLTKRSAAIIAASVIAVGGGAAAWAVNGWNITGSGTATAASSNVVPMNADITLSGNVFPGRSLTAVALVDNSNEFPVLLTGLTPGAVTVTKGGAPNDTCKNSLNTSSISATLPTTPPRIERGNDRRVEFPVVIGDLDDSCVNSDFRVAFTFTGKSTV